MKIMVVVLGAFVGAVMLSGAGRSEDDSANRYGTEVAFASRQTPAGRVKPWAQRWCRAQPGITRDGIRRLMGPPTEEYTPEDTPDDFYPPMVWEAGRWRFVAYVGARDRVMRLRVATAHLGASERGWLKCAPWREDVTP